ncbi:cytochrome c oxidase subunit II [Breoghania sp. L-A4]|uniref:cytochrome c oxidase subunit II n=1 Tax=Breoghania sp. L-A4 TaxID=2304600 RepID=UPI000E3581DE|nr:cytochrome c oxidase subunit II [Breoghania sp. L-A4]AXS41382.1 cytochrome c oxidase subunit II [Breoghania sp. L-A4]
MIIAIALIILAAGSVLFHFMSPWWSTPIASNWGYIDNTITITFWITGVAFVLVVGFMVYCLIKFRYVEGRRADYEPENKRLEVWLTAITAIGVAGMLAPGLFVWNQYVTVPEDAVVVEVMGNQWQWSYRLPGADGKLGTTAVEHIDDNAFGLNPDDPAGRDDILIEAADLHLLLDQPVKVQLRSIDVLHDFYVPQFRAKMDMVPGMVTYFWLTPNKAGTYDILCAELCGVGHHVMRGEVVVEAQEDYDAWVAEQETYEQYMARNAAPRTLEVAQGEPAAKATADATPQ